MIWTFVFFTGQLQSLKENMKQFLELMRSIPKNVWTSMFLEENVLKVKDMLS